MPGEEFHATVQDEGVVLLRNFFAGDVLTRLREAASRCFGAIESCGRVSEHYRFTPQANSVLLAALLDFGIESEAALMAPLARDGLNELFTGLVGGRWRCRLGNSWARKKFAPRNAPRAGYRIQDWHQDGALGAQKAEAQKR